MKKIAFLKIKNAVLTLFGIETLPTNKEGNVEFSEEQLASLKATFGDKFPERFMENLENETGDDTLVKEQSSTIETLNAQLADTQQQLQDSQAESKKKDDMIKVLGDMPEDDLGGEQQTPPAGGNQNQNPNFLFGEEQSWNAMARRPWNQRAEAHLAGNSWIGSTGYTEVDVQQVIDDLGDFARVDMHKLITYNQDVRTLPGFWETVFGANDEGVIDQLFTGEVTQARKKNFLPKGRAKFEPEMYKMYPCQIDLEFVGYELQKLEETWMIKYIRSSGSQPDKMPFIMFLIGEFLKKASKEDMEGAMNGIHIPIDDDATEPGQAINKMRGLRKLFRQRLSEHLFCTFKLGKPAEGGMLDYVDRMVMMIPEDVRSMPGMVLYLSNLWYDKYIKEYETTKGTYPSFSPGADYKAVDRHPNIRLEPLHHLGTSDLMFITDQENIFLLENIPGEGKMVSLQRHIRNIIGTADYKKSIHVYSFGSRKAAGEIDYINQRIWMNDVEDLYDHFITVKPDLTVLSTKHHTSLLLPANTVADKIITDITDANIGDIIYIRGGSDTNPAKIETANAKFTLTANITFTKDVMIKLFKRAADDFVELERGTEPVVENETVRLAPNATTADADEGWNFLTGKNTGATAITNIENAVASQTYRIEGAGGTTNATTIANAGNFSLTAAMTLTNGAWIELYYNGSKFIELGRG